MTFKPGKFWKRGDAVVSDVQRIDIIGKRLFRSPMKGTDMVTFEQAKQLAYHVLHDHEYRSWRVMRELKRIQDDLDET